MKNNIFENYKNKNLFLISGLDSIGVPYTPDNWMLYSYTDFLISKFKENSINIEYVNLSSLAISKTHQLIKILEKNYSKNYYTKINKRITEYIINTNQYKRPINTNFLQDYFKQTDDDINITTKLIEAREPIFILSCGAMDLKNNLKIYTYKPEKYILKIIFNFFQELNNTMNKIEKILKYILNLNSTTKIYMLGVYPLSTNKIIETALIPFVILYNKKLKHLCEKYDNVYFVDIFDTKNYMSSNDGHPNLEGHKFISSKILDTMNQKNLSKKR